MLYLRRVQANRGCLKLLLFGLLLFCGTGQAWAQKNNPQYDTRKIHFGFTLAYNSSIFQPRYSTFLQNHDSLLTVTPRAVPGFGLGVVGVYSLTNHLDLRLVPSLHFAAKQIDYTFRNTTTVTTKTVSSANVEVPLLFKLKSDRLTNFRLYVVAGPKFSLDMSSQAKVRDDIERVKVGRTDISAEYGIGADFYLPYFKFSPEIKIAQGFQNVLVPESHVFSAPLDGLRARTIYFSLIFE